MTTYKDSGVDINKADKFVDFIKKESPTNSNVISGVGGFASLFSLEGLNYKNPVIVSSTDGVGTKLLIASEVKDYRYIGIDLVAMCVNDLICHGADPLFFLDYYATGKLDIDVSKQIVLSILEGCKIAKLSLVGGETAELPGIYSDNKYDLAGFSVGIVDKSNILPSKDISSSDVLVGFDSSGFHSNGFSLIRNVFTKLGISYSSISPWGSMKWSEILLSPTKIYVDEFTSIRPICKGLAHITGGGITQNIERIIPNGFKIELDYSPKDFPELFQWIKEEGEIPDDEMSKVFNCGVGMVAIVSEDNLDELLHLQGTRVVGRVIAD